MSSSAKRFPRLILMLLFVAFAAPVVIAWVMVTWRIGIPSHYTAHGDVSVTAPPLEEWPLTSRLEPGEQWMLVFECVEPCDARQDELWRLHRALGREAGRLQRLRIGGDLQMLPGETATAWHRLPNWRGEQRVWVLDPAGRPALAYHATAPAADMLKDIRHLFKVNAL